MYFLFVVKGGIVSPRGSRKTRLAAVELALCRAGGKQCQPLPALTLPEVDLAQMPFLSDFQMCCTGITITHVYDWSSPRSLNLSGNLKDDAKKVFAAL